MRFIQKQQTAPAFLLEWIAEQQSAGINLHYDNFQNPQKAALRRILIGEQFGLCGYTGKRIVQDARKTHIEHLIPQSKCRDDLEKAGGVVGRDLCCDLDYYNMIAALTTEGINQYGACARGSWFEQGYINPTDPVAVRALTYTDDGRVITTVANDDAVEAFIEKLNLDFLQSERRDKIQALLPIAIEPPLTPEDLQSIIDYCDTPVDGLLPEFCFAIKAVASALL